MGREPVTETPMLPTRLEEGPNRGFLVDLDRVLRGLFLEYGLAINDDLITVSDFVRTITSAYTMLDTDRNILADATGGAFAITLPAASDAEPHIFRIKKIDAVANVTIQRAGVDTFEGGGTNVVLGTQWHILSLISDRVSMWHILHQGAP